ncbi:MAG: homocysteine S-methyltransferase family protein, partial [Bacteroidales bacterium]|nr:homocysteine S-methyltransferase family protein [Bacteroidales bacterium]
MYILDGAMGTMIQHALVEEANHDLLCLTRPGLIRDIHRAYLEAGASIVSTNSFNANRISQQDYGTADRVGEMNRAAARLAREVCGDFMRTHPDKKCYVAGSIGPTNKLASMSPKVEDPGYRAISFVSLADAYREQIAALLDGGVDILLIETVFDTLNAKAALFAAQDVLSQRGLFGMFPVMLSATVADLSGRTLSGQSIEAFVASVSHFPLWSIGLNCSFGAEKLAPFVRQLSAIAPCKVSAHPNAGLPDVYGCYTETPKEMAQKLKSYVAEGRVDIIGGCCGTTPEHIAEIAHMVEEMEQARRPAPPKGASNAVPCFSGLDVFELRDPIRFALIGERANVAGSKKFARLIKEEQYEEALGIAREMVRAGAHIIDVNMDDPLLDAPKAMSRFLHLLAAEPEIARLPIMLDSSRWEVLEAGLACVQGKSIVNSISLKEGKEAFKAQA